MKKKNNIDRLAMILLIVGGVNWGLFGLFDLNLVELIFGSISWLETTVYGLVGASAVYIVYNMGYQLNRLI